jgi:hypothetical protein
MEKDPNLTCRERRRQRHPHHAAHDPVPSLPTYAAPRRSPPPLSSLHTRATLRRSPPPLPLLRTRAAHEPVTIAFARTSTSRRPELARAPCILQWCRGWRRSAWQPQLPPPPTGDDSVVALSSAASMRCMVSHVRALLYRRTLLQRWPLWRLIDILHHHL